MVATNEQCKTCTKDWTKCRTCSVMMQWVKEHKHKNSISNEDIKIFIKIFGGIKYVTNNYSTKY